MSFPKWHLLANDEDEGAAGQVASVDFFIIA
jgi:hypothetical protein